MAGGPSDAMKKTLMAIPMMTVKAGPRDGEPWKGRLKQELMALIAVGDFPSTPFNAPMLRVNWAGPPDPLSRSRTRVLGTAWKRNQLC